MKIGILALQGAVEPHQKQLDRLGISWVAIRRPEHLEDLSGLILPGGESTTMVHLLKLKSLWQPLSAKLQQIPAWGICAGAILLANKVTSPSQPSFELVDIEAERNSYGTQMESFIAPILLREPLKGQFEGVFIRAPRLRTLSDSVRVLGKHENEGVIYEQGPYLVSAFHPELTEDLRLLEYFLSKCQRGPLHG